VKIALVTYSTRPRGGVVHTLALAEALARAGADVTVWSLARGGDGGFFRRLDPAVTVRLVPFADVPDETVGQRILRSIAVLGAAIDTNGFDVVHAQDCISANAVPRCVRTIHHLDHFTTPELAACHEQAIVRPYAHITVSKAVAAQVHKGWGIESAVIPNGVEAARFAAAASSSPTAAAARERWRGRLGTYVLAVGGIEPRKGTLDLVAAMGELRRTRPDVRLVIAGGETLFDYRDYRTEVDTLSRELGVDPEVLGTVDHDELPSLVAAAGVLAFPSTKEGFGLAAMEALAAGVPLVTRELPVLREVFGGAALFAATASELAAALACALHTPDPNLREAGRALAGRHSWDAAAAAHLAFYTTLPGESPRIS
jgi:glycosyltransferase-like protein